MPPGTPVKTKSLDAFFKDATKEEDWLNAEENADVVRFRALVTSLKELLKEVKVFQIGKEAETDVFVVGRTESGWAGLKTKVVQT